MGTRLDLSDFTQATAYVNENFNTFAKDRVATDVGMKLFKVQNVDFRTEVVQMYDGLSGIKKISEGQDLPSASGKQGDSITFVQTQYGVKIPVTKPMRIFDRYGEVQQLVQTITDDSFDKIDQSLADILVQGFATTYTDVYGDVVSILGPDGKVLFSATHTSGSNAAYSFKNIINDGSVDNPTLSRTAVVKTKAKALKYKDPTGITRPVHLDTIVVGPDLEDLARRIVESDGVAGTPNKDTNSYIKSMNVVVWERLGSAGDGTDTSAFWFMIDSKKIGEGLRAYFKQKPQIAAPAVYGPNMIWNYELDYFYDRGFVSPIYIYGSRGTNA